MESNPLYDAMRELAGRIADSSDEAVAEFGACIAEQYRQRRAVLWALLAVRAVEGEPIDESHPQLIALDEDFLDRLRHLVAWARETNRL